MLDEAMELDITPAAQMRHVPKHRPVKLQVKRTGIWHDVTHFDAGDQIAEQQVRVAVQLLCRIDARTEFRIMPIVNFGLIDPLQSYTAEGGWVIE